MNLWENIAIKARDKKVIFSFISCLIFLTTFLIHSINFVLVNAITLFVIVCNITLLYLFPCSKKALHFIGQSLQAIAKQSEAILLVSSTLLFCLFTYYLSGNLFKHNPVEVDSMAQYVGAKIFAQGYWTLPSHPLARFFDIKWFINDGKFYTFYPPGHMFILSLGQLIRVPAIVNPVLGAAAMISSYFLTKEIAGKVPAKITLLLFLISPFIIFLSSEYDNRSTALLTATLFMLFYIKSIKYCKIYQALLAGFFFGYFFITRPQTTVFFAIPFVIYGLYLLFFQFKKYWKIHLAMAFIVVLFILFFLYYNIQTTGEPFLTGYQKYFGAEVVPGYGLFSSGGLNIWFINLYRVANYMLLFHEHLFGWPISSLFIAFLLFFFNAHKPFCLLLASVFFSIFFGLTLSKYTYNIFGPRYLYEISSIVIILTAISFYRLPFVFRKLFHIKLSLNEWYGAFGVLLFILVIIALQTSIKDRYVLYADNYQEADNDLVNQIVQTVKIPAVVLLNDIKQQEAVVYLQPWDDKNPIIFANDRGKDNYKIINYYPSRNVYVVHNNQIIKISPK